jgi:hypothetical protein
MDQPGRITLLLIDFSRRTFILRAQNIDLTGLGSPMQLDISVGAYLLSGEVDETVINGDELIPFRLMRDYQDQIRLTEVVLKKGLTKGTDILTVSGDIATDNPGINLTNQKVIINWGDQPFAIPARSFIQTKNRNRYTCKVDVPEGFVDCLIDFDQFLFTVNLSKASLNATSGRVKFMIRFAQFKQFEYVQLQNNQDQLRVTEVAVNKGQTPGTDTLAVCGEITTDNPGINLTSQKVIINWGDQPFAIPAGSFIKTKNLNKYACMVDVPGGFMDCLIDFDQCLFTVNLSKASLNATSGRVKFMIRFSQFKQFEYVQI